MVRLAAEICEDKKGTDTRILELDPADAGFTDFFLITSGSNTRQTGAIADEIELRIKRDFGTYAKSVEGRRSGEWILLDYIDFVVHIFTEQTREFYDIERLRKSAKSLDTAELTAQLKYRTEAARKKAPGKKAARSLEAGIVPGTDLDAEDNGGRVPVPPRKLAQGESGAPAKKAAKKAPPKKAPGKKAPGKAAAKHAAPEKASAKKAPAKKAAAKKAAKQPAASSNVQDLSPRALSAGQPSRGLPAPSSDE